VWTGTSPFAIAVAVALFAVRMFAITAFYHRYFSHRAFRTSRGWQFVFAVMGASAVQRGPLWWAAHHRHHHVHSDQPDDTHSALQDGFLWSHMGWFLARQNFATRTRLVRDLARYPELRWLDRYDVAVPAALFVALWTLGAWLEFAYPALGTGPWQLIVWGFCISTVVLFHTTFLINSLAHRWGSRRYETGDESRNNALLALLTFGEGWHNNHHRYPGAARQGFYWWEVDLSWYGLRLLEALGIVRDLRRVPASVLAAGRREVSRP
jgi:stearoyl-CoA desaturase (Delta-9 desaturase)